jgi:hypothetical protein
MNASFIPFQEFFPFLRRRDVSAAQMQEMHGTITHCDELWNRLLPKVELTQKSSSHRRVHGGSCFVKAAVKREIFCILSQESRPIYSVRVTDITRPLPCFQQRNLAAEFCSCLGNFYFLKTRTIFLSLSLSLSLSICRGRRKCASKIVFRAAAANDVLLQPLLWLGIRLFVAPLKGKRCRRWEEEDADKVLHIRRPQ